MPCKQRSTAFGGTLIDAGSAIYPQIAVLYPEFARDLTGCGLSLDRPDFHDFDTSPRRLHGRGNLPPDRSRRRPEAPRAAPFQPSFRRHTMDFSIGPISRDKEFKDRRRAVLGQTYVPLHVTEHSASLHATMPPGTFAPMPGLAVVQPRGVPPLPALRDQHAEHANSRTSRSVSPPRRSPTNSRAWRCITRRRACRSSTVRWPHVPRAPAHVRRNSDVKWNARSGTTVSRNRRSA